MIKHLALACIATALASMPADAEPVRLVTGDDWPPYSGQQLAGGGMLTEIVLRAFSLAGMQTTLDWASWKRGYELTRIGDYDATFAYAKKADREAYFLYSEPLSDSVRAVFARPGSSIDPGRLETFRGRTLCVPIGFIIYPRMDALLQERAIAIERPPSMESCARMLAAGRVDFFITDALAGEAALRQAKVGTQVVRLAKPFNEGAFYLIVSRQRPGGAALIAGFNTGLNRLKSSGEYARIVQKHLHRLP